MLQLLSAASLVALVLADPGFVTLPVKRVPVNNTATNIVTKNRVARVPEVLKSSVYQYLVSFDLGSPGQTNTASIDTGSSDLWVYGPDTGAPTTYDHSQSSSAEFVNSGFEIAYVDGSSSSGDYYIDKIKWGSTEIDFQFAVTTQKYQNMNGVFGIAQEASEASEDGEYPNFPVALKNAGKIESVAYSLFLDDVNSDSGTLLYGAVDTSKYTGPLKALPITSSDGFNVDFEVKGHSLNGVLDAGTSLTYLPDEIVSSIASDLGATYNDQVGAYGIEGSPSGSLTYTFGGVDITVPASELFIELAGDGNGYFLTILPWSQSQYYLLLGDSFLRSAYVVYDLSSNQIAIAQANYNSGESHYKTITSSGIPGAE